MTVRAYFGFAAPDNEPHTPKHTDTDKQQTRRLVTTAGVGTVATAAALAVLWGTIAPTPAAAEPFNPEVVATDFVPYEGQWVEIKAVAGTGGLFLRDSNDNIHGLMGEGDRAIVLGAHPTNPHRVMVVQITSGHGGWGVDRGYVNTDFTRNVNGGPLPVGG